MRSGMTWCNAPNSTLASRSVTTTRCATDVGARQAVMLPGRWIIAPVYALLSGSLLAVSFYAILRFYQVAAATLGSGFPRDALLAFGVASLLLAALYVFGLRDIKRLLAYSSVEHMGILAIGVSFGAPVALAGVLLHVLAHAAAKGNAFMGAGVF